MGKEELEAVLARIDVWLLVFGALVVIGVGGESFFGIRHWLNSRKLQTLSRAEEQQREEVIARANENAAQANERAAKAEQRAAEATLELAKLRQPRILAPEQGLRIAGRIKAFSGQPFAAYVFQDSESIDLANAIGRALLRANWAVQGPDSDLAIGKLGVTITSGVRVEIAPSRKTKLSAAAASLSAALTAEGISSKEIEVSAREHSPDTIHIVIGKKQ